MYIKYNINSAVFPSMIVIMRYNHLRGITFAASGELAFITAAPWVIWLFICCICTLLKNVKLSIEACLLCDNDGGQF